jgi:hypothetical protein
MFSRSTITVILGLDAIVARLPGAGAGSNLFIVLPINRWINCDG